MEKVDSKAGGSRAAINFTVLVVVAVIAMFAVFRPIAMPIGFSLFFGFVFRPLVKRLDLVGLPRTISVLAVMAALSLILGAAIVKLLPFLYREFLAVLHLVPTALLVLEDEWLPAIAEFSAKSGIIDAETVRKALNRVAIFIQVAPQLKMAALKLWDSAYTLLSGALNLGLVPVLTFFVLKDFEVGRRFVFRLIPKEFIHGFEVVAREISNTLRIVITGQIKIAVLLAIFYSIGFSMIGVPDGIPLGIITGICRMVPYLDAVVGIFLTSTVTLSQSLSIQKIVGPTLVVAAVQLIDGMIITPRIMGRRIGLHPGVIICSLIAFGSHFGFMGVLLAMPVTAVVRTLMIAMAPLYARYFGILVQSGRESMNAGSADVRLIRQLKRARIFAVRNIDQN